jgi:signal transduction histidine kinase
MSAITDRARELVISTQRHEGNQVCIAVQDSGSGMDQQVIKRVFDAFFTTKPHGMGIGLSISRSIIEAHGGRLWALSNEGPGATFRFVLPGYDPGRT